MSTRCAIGFQNNPIQFDMIYSHYDGYPEHVGKLLVQYWNSIDRCKELVNGPQIRNFDHDGTAVRFTDSPSAEAQFEQFDSIVEILDSGYDYAYLYDEWEGCWKCFTKDRDTREPILVAIPSEEPVVDPAAKPTLDQALKTFVAAADAKYGGYAYATGYLTATLTQIEDQLPAGVIDLMINQLVKTTAECKA